MGCTALQLWNKYLGERRLACRGLKVTDPALERLCDTYERALVGQPSLPAAGSRCLSESTSTTWSQRCQSLLRWQSGTSARENPMQLENPGGWIRR